MERFGSHVTAIMFDTNDLDTTVEFWSSFLGLNEVHRTDTYVYLDRMTADGPHLAFQLVGEPRAAKNRLHLDIRVDDREAAIAGIIAAGGAIVGDVDEPGFPAWTVVSDAAGNEFCIYESDA